MNKKKPRPLLFSDDSLDYGDRLLNFALWIGEWLPSCSVFLFLWFVGMALGWQELATNGFYAGMKTCALNGVNAVGASVLVRLFRRRR